VVINRNFLLAFTLTLIAFSFSFAPNYANAASCTESSGVITDDISGGDAACTVTPDYAYFPLYKLGLCTEVPTYLNYQSVCTMIVNNSTAQEVEVSEGSQIQLSNNLSLSEGTYPAAIVLLGNTIGIKHSVVFNDTQDGWDYSGSTAVEGKYCSTSTASGSEDDIGTGAGDIGGFFDCDTSALTAGKFTETSGAYLTSGTTCSISSGAIVRSSADLAFSTSSGTSVVCGMYDADTLETYTSGASNATRQLVVQTFTNPVNISPTTTSLDVGFKVEDMLSIEGHTGPGSLTFVNGFIDGVEFKVAAN
jgi:hypothetical protein